MLVATLLATAAPASAVTPKQAAKKALNALGSKTSGSPVIVFGLPDPVRAGSRVTEQGTRRHVVKTGKRAFFFYQDGAPYEAFPHPGRVALVNAKSGKVKLSRTFRRKPLINGKLPAFLRSARAYRSSKYVVFDASTRKLEPAPAADALPLSDPLEPPDLSGPNKSPKAESQAHVVKQGFGKRVTLTATDENGDLLTYFISKEPLRGTVTGQPPDVTYTPNPGYLGPDHFTFKASDGEAESNAAQISVNVVPLGQPPTVTTSAGCTNYVEQGPAVVVDPQLTVSDPDDLVLDSARVRFPAGQAGGDNLLFTDQNGISGSYNENEGVLTLTGTTSVANYQAALASVRYRNISSGNPPPTKDIEFVVNDAGNDSAPAVKQICITGGNAGQNDPPTGEPGEGALQYIENDGPVPVDGMFIVGDPDSTQLSGATVKFVPFVTQPVDEEGEPTGPPVITNTFAPAEDELTFTDQLGITGSYDDETGIMTLSGSASLADYETAIRAVMYENVSEDPSDAIRRIQFQVTDSTGANSVPKRRDIFITPVNDAPEVDTSAGSTDYTGSATVVDSALSAIDVDDDDLEGATVSISDGFVDGDSLVFVNQLGISGVYDTGTGVLTLSGTAPVADYETALRSIEYDHAGGTPTGERTVLFSTNDGDLDSAPATKHVEINDKPVLDTTDADLAYTENAGPLAVDPGITATDVDSLDLTGATVTISSGFSSGEDDLVFTDQNGIAGAYNDATGVLTLSGSASIMDYETALRSVTYENVSDDPTTSRTVTFQVDDGAVFNNLSDTASRNIAITPVNDAPSVTTSEGSTAYTEGDPATAVDGGLTTADVDDDNLEGATVAISSGFQSGDDLVYVDQNGISGVYNTGTGVLTLTGTASAADYETALRSVEYSHSGDDPSASKTVSFTVNDGDADSATATKDVAVTAVNDAPTVTTTAGSTAYTEGDAGTAVDSGLTVSDPDDTNLEGAAVAISSGFQSGDDLVYVDQLGISGVYNTGTGELTLSGTASEADYETALRSIEYRHTGDDPSASKTVSFTVNDGEADSNAATKDIAVTAVNDKPVVDTTDSALAYTEGDGAVAVDNAVAVDDADSANLTGATVAITGNFATAEDSLVFVDQLGIAGVYDSTSGVLTLSGTAAVSEYRTALQSVAYENTSGDPSTATRTVSFQVTDGTDQSDAATRDVEVTAVNQDNEAPVVTTSAGNTTYVLGDAVGSVVDASLTVTDADDTNIESGHVQIDGFEPGDELIYVDLPGISGTFDSEIGVLTLTGSAPVADYETALRTVRFRHFGDNQSAFRTIAFKVNDGDVDSAFALKQIDLVTP